MTAASRPKRLRSMADLLGSVQRILKAVATRQPEGDNMDELLMLAEIEVSLDNAIQGVIDGLRYDGVTWKSIGEVFGTTGQAANMRWGKANGELRRQRLAEVQKRQAAVRAKLKAETQRAAS